MTVHDIPADYDGTIGVFQRMRAQSTGAAGDPVRVAEILVQVVKRDNLPSDLLGMNAADMALDYSRKQLDEATAWENVSRSADFSEPYPPSSRRTSRRHNP